MRQKDEGVNRGVLFASSIGMGTVLGMTVLTSAVGAAEFEVRDWKTVVSNQKVKDFILDEILYPIIESYAESFTERAVKSAAPNKRSGECGSAMISVLADTVAGIPDLAESTEDFLAVIGDFVSVAEIGIDISGVVNKCK